MFRKMTRSYIDSFNTRFPSISMDSPLPRGMTTGYFNRPQITESGSTHYSTDKPHIRLWKVQKKHKCNCFQRQKIMLKLQTILLSREKN